MAITPPSDDDITAIAGRYGRAPAGRRRVPGADHRRAHVVRRGRATARGAAASPAGAGLAAPRGGRKRAGRLVRDDRYHRSRRRPLAGRRVAIKDNVAVAGVPMTNGSKTVEGYVPRQDATVVTRLLAAGATIAGKATCEELCFDGGSHTSHTGPVRNPWNRAKSTGGSSSGSAALVAAGEVDMAIGGDQAGSIRIPSAFCGTVGHKPTHGLVPYTGAFPIENTIDHLGPITRTVRDAALMLGVLAGPGRPRPAPALRGTPPGGYLG